MPSHLSMRTRLKSGDLHEWLVRRLPHVVRANTFHLQDAGEWACMTFGTPITGAVEKCDCKELIHEIYDEDADWTWFQDRFYFRKERAAVVFKLRWGA